MNQVKTWINEHRKASIICLCLLLMFIGGSAMSALRVANNRAQQAQEQSEDASDVKVSGDAAENVTLTSEQKTLIADYDDDTEDFIKMLMTSVWSVNDGRYSLTFSDNSYTETVNGESTTHSYAISRLDKDRDQQGLDCDTAVFLTDTGTHIVTYTATRSQDGSTVSSSLASSSLFAMKDTGYVRADVVTNISVKGLTSEGASFFGKDEQALVKALSNWCAVHFPSANEATWSKKVSIDYEEGTVTTTFDIKDKDDATASAYPVACIYTQESGKFSFSM